MNTNLNLELASIVASWQIPPVGCVSASPMPDWLIDRWVNSRPGNNLIVCNGFGGMTLFAEADTIVLYPEDWIHLLSDNTIQFCPSDATP